MLRRATPAGRDPQHSRRQVDPRTPLFQRVRWRLRSQRPVQRDLPGPHHAHHRASAPHQAAWLSGKPAGPEHHVLSDRFGRRVLLPNASQLNSAARGERDKPSVSPALLLGLFLLEAPLFLYKLILASALGWNQRPIILGSAHAPPGRDPSPLPV
ncbi:unnamed protein product [Rangifer tarandus platyrhynchus]|uniref:Uncharacterized protein n=1 Tax=Rangifer tarandus platyrhynchus TaxID=3082113 RepID=A0ABN8YDM5_RANTA|nr:unnamed protein product [Rangifer tarandus platyrhynchus]